MPTQPNRAQTFETVQALDAFISQMATLGIELTEEKKAELATIRKQLEAQRAQDDATPLYSAMKAQSKFPITDEFEGCVTRTVEKLMADGCDSDHPGLLLGNIQCGKTNTFENIIALAFDKGIEVCVILTKGTKTLASQTLARAKADFAFARKTDKIDGKMKVMITDIMDLRHKGVSTIDTNDDLCRQIIICKKEKRNLESLIELYEKISPNLKTERTLVVDDEADFASRVYRGSKQNTDLAKIADLIDKFRQLPVDCRYLEVTATPYSLYLQPDGRIIRPNNLTAMPFRPKFTELVPVHSKYIGGKQYFEESQDENSMYSHLFVPVTDQCLKALSKPNRRYLKSTFHSQNMEGMSNAICGYFMAGAIRSLQAERESKRYSSSCLIHIQVTKSGHEWESSFIKAMIEDIRDVIMNEDIDLALDGIMEPLYDDFKASISKGIAAGLLAEDTLIPDYATVMERIKLLMDNDFQVRIVNSDNDVNSLLDEHGQLALDRSLNIFIGGSILDRGITVGNMLCFFYGRNPDKFQMDTALQHARMYGARSLEDMSVTRFYTTELIHYRLSQIHDIDSLLRTQFTTRNANGDIEPSDAVIIGYTPGIKPCAKAKIKLSETTVVRAHSRLLPVGFQIGNKKTVAPIVKEIDELIKSRPEFNEKSEMFMLDEMVARKILGLIEETHVYGEKYENVGREWDSKGTAAVMHRALEPVGDGKVWCIWRDGRQMSRKFSNQTFADSPDAGNVEGRLARRLATDRPALVLLREEGAKAQGWSGTPFYWPVLFTPENFTPGIYAKDNQKDFDDEDVEPSGVEELIQAISPEDILRLPIEQRYLDKIYLGVKKFEYRLLEPKTAGRYIEMSNKKGKPKLAEGVNADDVDAGVFSLNRGVFPFILKKFKYILIYVPFKQGNGSQLLLRLTDGPDWVSACPSRVTDYLDLLHGKYGDDEEVEIDNEYAWCLKYSIAEVVGPKIKFYEDMKEQNPEEYAATVASAELW